MSSQSLKHLYHFGPFSLNQAERILMRQGRLVEAEPKTIATLTVFIERRGHVLTKEHLRIAIWGPETFVEPNTVERQICVLRKILRAAGSEEVFIETIPKRGYRFVTPVVEQSEPASRALFVAANLKAGILRGIQVVSRALGLLRKGVP